VSERIELRDASGARAVILPALGGWLTEYAAPVAGVGMIDAIHHDEAVVARYPREMWAGMPLLFPLVSYNHIPGAQHTYEWEGQRYPLPQHGFARRKPWRVASSDSGSATLSLASDTDTRAVYPWEFQYDLTYRLSAGALVWEQRVSNLSSRPMPLSAGFHPYFRVPLGPHSRREDCVVRCPKSVRLTPLDEATRFERADFAAQDWPVSEDVSGTLLLGQLARKEFALVDRAAGVEVVFSWEGAPRYTSCAIWSRNTTEPFYCIEPWTALPNSFSRRAMDLIILAPGETMVSQFELAIRKGR
jgi:galactose mutarotase-like enzyme